jgi:hypothetical protein
MTLAVMRAHAGSALTSKQTKATLQTMENFHAQFTGVTTQRAGGGTARMYAAAAEDLTQAQDRNAAAQVLKEYVAKLRERVPSYQEFEANLREIVFLCDNTKQKPLVQYLLQRVDRHLQRSASVDYGAMTIEHIAPEHPVAKSSVPLSHVGLICNLILLPDELNVKVDNKQFAWKKAEYTKHHVPMDEILLKAKSWGSG